MKTEIPKETRYTHDFPSHYRKVITELERDNAALREVIEDIRNEIENDSIDNSMKAGRVYCILRNARAKEAKP